MVPRVETKVTAATIGAGLAGVVLWVLQTYVFKGGSVPQGLVTLVDLAVPAIAAWVAGYFAPHTPRPAPAPPLPGPPTPPAPPAGRASVSPPG